MGHVGAGRKKIVTVFGRRRSGLLPTGDLHNTIQLILSPYSNVGKNGQGNVW